MKTIDLDKQDLLSLDPEEIISNIEHYIDIIRIICKLYLEIFLPNLTLENFMNENIYIEGSVYTSKLSYLHTLDLRRRKRNTISNVIPFFDKKEIIRKFLETISLTSYNCWTSHKLYFPTREQMIDFTEMISIFI